MSRLSCRDSCRRIAHNISDSRSGERRARRVCALAMLRVREYLQFDSRLFRSANNLAALLVGLLAWGLGRKLKAILWLSGAHRNRPGKTAQRLTELVVKRLAAAPETFTPMTVDAPATAQTARFFADPAQLLGSLAIVLKSPRYNEKGVILVKYSYVFPLFQRLFDVEQITRHYHLVLEPSWSGYCDPNILCYAHMRTPVFVESGEPEDTEFLRRLNTSLIPVNVSSNWWVDHRIHRPLTSTAKDADLIMVAGWGGYKRYHRFFAALRTLRRDGLKLKTVLVGYSAGLTLKDIQDQAAHYSIEDQIEYFEGLTPEQVNEQMNRAKVNVLWSRKEGFNRVVIEGMFSGVPCIMRMGFNFGYHYPYVNGQTGCFASEADLPGQLASMVQNYRQYNPREWVLENMSCQKATQSLGDAIKQVAIASGESWTKELAVKVCYLHGMAYWNKHAEDVFSEDYERLRSYIRTNRGA